MRVATGLSSDVPAASTSRTSVGVTKRVRAAFAEHLREHRDEAVGHGAAAGAHDGDGARPRIGRGGRGGVVVRDASRERDGERAPHGGALGAETVEVGAAEAQHEAVAHGAHGRGASAARQERDLADRLAGADLGQRRGRPSRVTENRPGDDDVEGIGGLALSDQHLAALQGERLEFRRQGAPARRAQDRRGTRGPRGRARGESGFMRGRGDGVGQGGDYSMRSRFG